MEPISLVTSVSACCEIGDKVIQTCNSLVDVDGQVQERCHTIESYWQTARLQLDLLKRVESALGNDLCRILDNLVLQLSQKLSLADTALKKTSKQYSSERPSIWALVSKAKKVSWMWKRDPLDGLLSDFDIWHHRFNPVWFMVMKLADPLVDAALTGLESAHVDGNSVSCPSWSNNPLTVAAGMRRVLFPAGDRPSPKFFPPRQMKTSEILFSGAKTAFLEPENKLFIIDTIEVGPCVEARDILRDVSILAAKLAQADSVAFGLLNCKGVIPVRRYPARSRASQHASSSSNKPDYTSFQLVFRLPEDMLVLQSLRQLLLSSDVHISLSQKMRIARELAKAIHYVHTFAFVHKNVRPESILCFENDGASRSHAFLVGFHAFRAAGGGTILSGDIDWERNAYRHPSRQGFDPVEKYRMQHDIYSLGVCLLEIGLWETFVEYTTGEDGDDERPRAKVGKTYYRFEEWLKEKTESTGREASLARIFNARASSLKDYLVEQANTRLAPRMGDRYAQVVMTCLTCLDEENGDFGGADSGTEEVGEDTVAICFAEKILSNLDQLSMV